MKTTLILCLLAPLGWAEPLVPCKTVPGGGGELYPAVGEACQSSGGQVLVTTERPAMEKVKESLTPEEYKQREDFDHCRALQAKGYMIMCVPQRISVSEVGDDEHCKWGKHGCIWAEGRPLDELINQPTKGK